MLLAMMLSEKIAYYDNYVKSGAYSTQDRFSHFDRVFHDLDGKTWGIVGMGNIGHKVAGLDVLEKEPLEPSNPLSPIKDSTKLVITPHMSWASLESRTRLVAETEKNIEAFLEGKSRNVVNA